jgi:hypothetical protein
MGQAKLRGTFEQRKAEGIAKAAVREVERQRQREEAKARERERIAGLTKAQRKKERDEMMALATILQMGRDHMPASIAGLSTAQVVHSVQRELVSYPSEEEITGEKPSDRILVLGDDHV